MNIIIIIIIITLILLSFKWDIKESFYNGLYLWMPTRNTRLMNYDLRGDPYGLIIYPSYHNYTSPFMRYLYTDNRYDIFGRYYVDKSRKIIRKITRRKIKKITNEK